ncbi:IclR family transcriptional regulator [Streptomyces sp. MW-W600-10]|uniref:IclR family transcriptional regulator n=1 Tax=Streptomyces sp. MW-W600-10 TaxID=2829819 RepID=UPI001C44B310|nr:IclR family transcriptional regulator [Streptomyces sp. MW-W600-10]MBV7242924.1 IclR family transcriptional regulator [Streptomyces sp. MW-W600-10]
MSSETFAASVAPEPAPSAGRSGGVQSVARAARLLSAVVDSPAGATLTELAKTTGLNVSTVHRLLSTLTAEGLICRSSESERFLPGPVLLRLGRRSLSSSGLPDVTAVLKELADLTGETASVGMRRGESVHTLMSVQCEQPLRYLGEPGRAVPLGASAMGLAITAFDPASPLGQPPGTPPDTEDAQAAARAAWSLEVDLLAARFRGYTVFEESDGSGLRGVAAPVQSGSAYVRLAVDVQGPASRMTDDRLPQLGAAVTAAAESLRGLPVALALGQL